MICARCDEPIEDGQKYVRRDIESASGPGATVYLHDWCERIAAAQPSSWPTGLGSR
ncbi:hypothetical protein ACWCQN_13365 [Streptomyces sp. NPDC001984]